MSFTTFLKKITTPRESHTLDAPKPLNPDEIELRSYQEEDRRKAIRNQLVEYRLRRNKELLTDSTILKGKGSMLDSKNKFL
tara:strand:- start:1998 stop:2240 length:243 start_codon:yes stop_codon:yes gene_type:complete